MLIDGNKARNCSELAQRKKEAMIVELAFIKMNFKELPDTVIRGALKTNTSFGALLSNNTMKISTSERAYF